MTVSPYVEVGKQYPSKGDFIAAHPLPNPDSNVAAIDGIVLGSGMQTIRVGEGRYIFIDHHRGDRYSQLSVCKQSWERLRNNTLRRLCGEDGYNLDLYMNHVDEDSALTYAIFSNAPEIFADEDIYKRAREIVNLEDAFDRWLGLYDSDNTTLGHLLWIFESIHDRRFGVNSHFIEEKDTYLQNLVDVNDRFMRYVRGEQKALQIYGEAEIISSGKDWKLVRETGPGARVQMMRDGATEEVSLYAIHAGERRTGANDFLLVCPWPDARLDKLVERLNEEESGFSLGVNSWGGNSNFVASPRGTGSEKTTDELCKFLDSWHFEEGSFFWQI